MQAKEETAMFDLYIRVSQLGERTEAEATETYEAQCLQTAQRLDLEWDEIVSETNVSGATAVADRELERLIQKIDDGESEGIIVPWTDRFARDVIEGHLAYRRIALAGGRLIGAMDGLDSASPGNKEVVRHADGLCRRAARPNAGELSRGRGRRCCQTRVHLQNPIRIQEDS